MSESGQTVSVERLRYVASLLAEIGKMLPPPRRSTLAYLVHMARLEAESELDEREPGQR